MTKIFHALADPTRRKILHMIRGREHRATEIADCFHMSFPAISKHLKVLEEADFVHRNIRGRTHLFSLKAKTMKKAFDWVSFYSRFWNQNLDNLEKFLKK